MYEIWIPIGIALITLLVAILAFYKAKPIEKQQYDSQSMYNCFQILSSTEVKDNKKKVADHWRTCKQNKQAVIFSSGSNKTAAYKLKESCNQASALYQLGLLNQKHFKKVYGGTIVKCWKMLKDDIINERKINSKHCTHFEEVATKLMADGINDEPF